MTTTALDENLPLTNSQLIWRLTFLIAIWMTLFSSLGFIFTELTTEIEETLLTTVEHIRNALFG